MWGLKHKNCDLSFKSLFIEYIRALHVSKSSASLLCGVCLLGFVYCYSESAPCWKIMIFHFQSARTSAVVKDQCENQPMFLSSKHAEL